MRGCQSISKRWQWPGHRWCSKCSQWLDSAYILELTELGDGLGIYSKKKRGIKYDS
jgi:hypothetical protein